MQRGPAREPRSGQASSTAATPLVHALFDGLTIYGDDGLPEASLATRWEIAPDQRRVTFHLRPDGRFSNGRPVTADHIAYQAIRTLHPLTASPSAHGLDFVKGYDGYVEGTGRVLVRAAGGLAAGSIVEVIAADGRDLAAWRKDHATPPDANQRASTHPLALRDLGAAVADAYATVPAGAAVTIVEPSGGDRRRCPIPTARPGPTRPLEPRRRGLRLGRRPPTSTSRPTPTSPTRCGRWRAARSRASTRRSPSWPAADAKLARPAVTVRGADLLMLPEQLGLRVPDPLTFVIEAATPTPHIVMTTLSRVLRAVPREAVARAPRRCASPGTIVTSGPMHLVAQWRSAITSSWSGRRPTGTRPTSELDRLTA